MRMRLATNCPCWALVFLLGCASTRDSHSLSRTRPLATSYAKQSLPADRASLQATKPNAPLPSTASRAITETVVTTSPRTAPGEMPSSPDRRPATSFGDLAERSRDNKPETRRPSPIELVAAPERQAPAVVSDAEASDEAAPDNATTASHSRVRLIPDESERRMATDRKSTPSARGHPSGPARARGDVVTRTAAEEPKVETAPSPAPSQPQLAAPTPGPKGPHLDEVIQSVYRSYPLLQSAFFARNIAQGEHLSATGEFDLKFKAASENGPAGFYQTYRQSVGVLQPMLAGGHTFAGYRIGRGDFEPWYLERQTNGGGEFKAGVLVPLAKDRSIDERRMRLWQTAAGVHLVEPEIHAQLIDFVQDASHAYWNWVAASESYQLNERVLQLAENRTERIRKQVDAGLIDPPELTDNLRLVAERQGKLADSDRKRQQTAAKLSLYWRTNDGAPLMATTDLRPAFPPPLRIQRDQLAADIPVALANRPELAVLNFLRQQIDIEYAQAQNSLQPEVNAMLAGSQDVGEPTSSKRDKSEFEVEASLFVDVPLQRRKARGKIASLEGKLSQLAAKRRITEDKIVVDVQAAHAALVAMYNQTVQAQEAQRLAEDLAARERRNFDLGASDLLKVTLREQYSVESGQKLIDALLQYHLAAADYRAALAQDRQGN